MYIDNIKLFAKNKKRIGNPTTGSRNIQSNIGMEFGFEKCAMLEMKSDKWHLTERMEVTNQ